MVSLFQNMLFPVDNLRYNYFIREGEYTNLKFNRIDAIVIAD